MHIKYGGVLKSGDFIAVARQGYLELGWFEKQGKNTIHYFSLNNVKWAYDLCEEEKDFNLLYKYIKSHALEHPQRALKIDNPTAILTNQLDLDSFILGSELLKKYNYIK